MVVPAGYIPGFVCTLKTCSVKQWGFIHYQPTVPGNVLFLVIFSALAVAQLVLGIKFKTRTVGITMLFGLACETLGYVSRILLHYDPFDRAYFLWYLITLTIGPAFLAAAIYVCLGRIVVVYGEHISRIRPRMYTLFFVGCDIISLVIQAIGGGIAASVPLSDQTTIQLGTHILVAGLSFQVASLFAFSACAAEFLWRVHRNHSERNLEHADFYESRKFKMFLTSLGLATVCLFIRTVFRSVELSGGFGGHLANSEVQFMVLDGVMVIIACTCLTVMHPGIGFGDKWGASKFSFGGKKQAGGDVVEQSPERVEKLGVEVSKQ